MATPAQVKKRGRFSLILGTIIATVAFAAAAYADDISNDLDASIDAVAEVMPLTVGGADGTTQLYVTPRNGDGKNGCNLTGGTTLAVSVSSSNGSVATVSPSSVTFTACGDTATLTVTPHNEGSATVSVSQTSNSTGATFNLAPASFTVNVAPPPNTPPQVAVAGVTGGASYDKGSVPAATCQVTDAEDGNSSFAATLSAISGPNAADGIGEQTASCSYTDGGGLNVQASETYGIVDPSAPGIGYAVSGAEGNNGWYTSNVSLVWTVSEPESPGSLVKTGCLDQSITVDQAATTYECSASSAGGSAGPVSVVIKRDATKPTISASAGSYVSGAWTNQTVTVGFSCSDALSGLSGACPADVVVSGDTSAAGQDVSGSASDNAGNSETSNTINVKVDKTNPQVGCDAVPSGWQAANVTIDCTASDTPSGLANAADASFQLSTGVADGSASAAAALATKSVADNAGNSTTAGSGLTAMVDRAKPTVAISCLGPFVLGSSASASWTASDVGSGLATPASGSVTLDTSSVGTKTASSPAATDNVGHTGSASCTYSVIYKWAGFFQPIDNGLLNKAKAGSTVPVKFSLGGDQGLDILEAGYPSVSGTFACGDTSGADLIEEYAPTGTTSGLKYDALANQYIYNWKTDSKWAGQCRQLRVKLADGTMHTANFNFFK